MKAPILSATPAMIELFFAKTAQRACLQIQDLF